MNNKQLGLSFLLFFHQLHFIGAVFSFKGEDSKNKSTNSNSYLCLAKESCGLFLRHDINGSVG